MVAGTRRSHSLLGLALAGIVVVGAGVAGVISAAGGLPELLARDPPRMDYAWLRRGLAEAEQTSDRLARDTSQASTLAAARALQSAILYSRASARRTGTKPVPATIRTQLAPYFTHELIANVRWAYPNEIPDLGSAIAAWYGRHGGAITLRDTIVFSTPYAASSRYLWAHELTHVMQFEELGVADFTRIYTVDPQVLEQQAWDNARRIEQDLQRMERRRTAGQPNY